METQRKITKAVWVGLEYLNDEDKREEAFESAREYTKKFTLTELRYSAYIGGYQFQYTSDTVYLHYCPTMN